MASHPGRILLKRAAVPVVCALAATIAAAQIEAQKAQAEASKAPPVEVSNKWRIEFKGEAENAGKISFRFGLPGGAREIEVAIEKGTGENGVAAHVRDGLKKALGEEFSVERDDYENTLIKAKGQTADFPLELACSSVTGLLIKIRKE